MGREDRYCLRVELRCNPCEEPQKPSSKSHRHERRDKDSKERSYKSHMGRLDNRPESPPLAIRRAAVLPVPVERHRSRHGSVSDTRARSPTIQVIYSRVEEVTTSNPRRSTPVRRRDTAPAHPEEATAPHHRRSSSRSRHEPPGQYHGWSPERKKDRSYYAEPVPAPPAPSWPCPEQDYNPTTPRRAPATPPLPPPYRHHTSDTHTSRRTESPLAGHTHTDGAADAGSGDSGRDPRSFAPRSAAAERTAPSQRESRRRDHDRPATGDSGRRDTHHRREHTHDRYPVEGSVHYYTSTDGHPAWVQYASYTSPPPQPHRNDYYPAYEETAHPFTAGPAYEAVPPPPPPHSYADDYHSRSSTHNHRTPAPHGDYYSRPSSHSYRSAYEPPPGPTGGSYPRSSGGAHPDSGGPYEPEIPPKDLGPYWAELGLPPGADDAAIRSAYKKLALQCHPDRLAGIDEQGKKQMEQRFVKVKEAHDILLEK